MEEGGWRGLRFPDSKVVQALAVKALEGVAMVLHGKPQTEGRTPLSSHHHLARFLQVVGCFVVYILWVILP